MEGKTQRLTEAMAEILEKKGAVAEVGPNHYAEFANLNDDQMSNLIRLVIIAQAEEINRMVFDEERRYTDADILKVIENSLDLMFQGWLRFNEDGKLYMFKPEGPKPAPEMEQLWEDRLARSVPLIEPTALNLQSAIGWCPVSTRHNQYFLFFSLICGKKSGSHRWSGQAGRKAFTELYGHYHCSRSTGRSSATPRRPRRQR
jgi:hypothetical protein